MTNVRLSFILKTIPPEGSVFFISYQVRKPCLTGDTLAHPMFFKDVCVLVKIVTRAGAYVLYCSDSDKTLIAVMRTLIKSQAYKHCLRTIFEKNVDIF